MLKHSVLIGLIVGMFAAASPAYAEKFVFVTTEWPPFTMTIDGKSAGIDVDLVREFCARNQIDADIQVIPWKRALEEVKAGTVSAIFTLKKTEERMKFLIYPTEQLEQERVFIASIKSKGQKASTLKDLQGAVVGVVRGNVYGEEFEAATFLQKDESLDDATLVKKLAAGRIDYLAGEEISLKYLATQEGIQLEEVYQLGIYPTYIGFSKTLGAQGEELAKKFDETMRQMVQEGVVKTIQEKYLNGQ